MGGGGGGATADLATGASRDGPWTGSRSGGPCPRGTGSGPQWPGRGPCKVPSTSPATGGSNQSPFCTPQPCPSACQLSYRGSGILRVKPPAGKKKPLRRQQCRGFIHCLRAAGAPSGTFCMRMPPPPVLLGGNGKGSDGDSAEPWTRSVPSSTLGGPQGTRGEPQGTRGGPQDTRGGPGPSLPDPWPEPPTWTWPMQRSS